MMAGVDREWPLMQDRRPSVPWVIVIVAVSTLIRPGRSQILCNRGRIFNLTMAGSLGSRNKVQVLLV